MKRGYVSFAFSMICGTLFSASASACPVATGVAAVPLVAVPFAVQSSCAVQPQQAAHPQAAAAQSVEAVPVVTAYAVPAVAFLATPLVIEQIVKVKRHRKIRTPVRSFLFR